MTYPLNNDERNDMIESLRFILCFFQKKIKRKNEVVAFCLKRWGMLK